MPNCRRPRSGRANIPAADRILITWKSGGRQHRASTSIQPDIYWPNFEYWVQRYEIPGNAIFVPEARLESAPHNALYAYGQARAFGFSPFAIDSLTPPEKSGQPKPAVMQVYELLDSVRDLVLEAQVANMTRGLVLHATSPRPTQTVALGGFLFEATLSRSWPRGRFWRTMARWQSSRPPRASFTLLGQV
jgi:hypothetical protein